MTKKTTDMGITICTDLCQIPLRLAKGWQAKPDGVVEKCYYRIKRSIAVYGLRHHYLPPTAYPFASEGEFGGN